MRNTRKILIAAAICSAAYFGLGVCADSNLQDYAFSMLHNTNLEFADLNCDDLGGLFGTSSGYCTVKVDPESVGPILEKLKLTLSNCPTCERASVRAVTACKSRMRDRGLSAELVLSESPSRLPQAAIFDRTAGIICFCFQFSGFMS